MKIAIYTLISDNFGNRLQNYATQTFLESLGHTVQTLPHREIDKKSKFKDMIRTILIKDRVSNYILFNKRINWSKEYLSKEYNHFLEDKYDYFFIGSDQVWNPRYSEGNFVEYLPFINGDKIVSFSASFGVSKIDKDTEQIAAYLKRMHRVSVREEAGVCIVKNISGIDANLLIDPTLLLDSTDWMKIAKKPKRVDTDCPYILTYFLGEKSNITKEKIDEYAKKLGYTVYNLIDETYPNLFEAGPSEFIYLVSKSKMVVTDSFHACVFSFLFEKPFIVFERESAGNDMMSRLETFLKKFDLERKFANNKLANDLLESDYSNGFFILDNERKRVLDYILSF